MPPTVSLVTLGCARNEVDSEELAARLQDAGWSLAGPQDTADVTLVNTCGFVEAAKRDSVEALLDAAGHGPVVAVGCLAERYGRELADELPEARVLSFDDYEAIGERLDDVLQGVEHVVHTPRDRRELLPLSPVERARVAPDVGIPGHAGGPRPLRVRLDSGPVAALKLASGCDRRCSFCAIPSFRGSFVSRPPGDVVAEARWLAAQGVRELLLVSENSTSYGKDLGDLRALEKLLPRLAAVEGVERIRVAYLQPAEVRPSLVEALATTPGVAPYFDLSFQHASGSVLRRMRRFGGTERFLALLADIRGRVPEAGVRSNVIVGFPGETDADVAELTDFLGEARLDAIGVFGYSDEEGTEAFGYADKVDRAEVARRVEHVAALSDTLMAERAAERVGERVRVLVERVDADGVEGRAAHQGPEDGTTVLEQAAGAGDVVWAVVVASDGVDLHAALT